MRMIHEDAISRALPQPNSARVLRQQQARGDSTQVGTPAMLSHGSKETPASEKPDKEHNPDFKVSGFALQGCADEIEVSETPETRPTNCIFRGQQAV